MSHDFVHVDLDVSVDAASLCVADCVADCVDCIDYTCMRASTH